MLVAALLAEVVAAVLVADVRLEVEDAVDAEVGNEGRADQRD